MAKALDAEMTSYTAAANVAEEVLAGIRTVLAFNGQNFEIKRYTQHLDEGRRNGVIKAKWLAAFLGLYYLVLFIALGVVIYFGTKVQLASN